MADVAGIGTAVSGAINTIADKFFMDASDKAKFKLEAMKLQQDGVLTPFITQITKQVEVIVAEAKGNWLQKSWRPMLMCLFGVIIANNYIIYPYLSLFFDGAPMMEVPPEMWDLLKIGLGGYVVGRSVEKVAKIKYNGGGQDVTD